MNTQLDFNFPVPTKLYFGAGKLSILHTLEMPGKKALVVISSGKSTRANGYLDRTLNELTIAGVETIVYDKVMDAAKISVPRETGEPKGVSPSMPLTSVTCGIM